MTKQEMIARFKELSELVALNLASEDQIEELDNLSTELSYLGKDPRITNIDGF